MDLSFVYNFLSKVLAIQVCNFIFALSFFVVFSSFFKELLGLFLGPFCCHFVVVCDFNWQFIVISVSFSNLED